MLFKPLNCFLLCLVMTSSLTVGELLNADAKEISIKMTSRDLFETLEFLISRIVDGFSADDGIIYQELRNSSSIQRNLNFLRRGLRRVDPLEMSERERKTFFINLYNILAMESLLQYPTIPDSMEKMPQFEHQHRYKVGRYEYDLATIKHAVLRDKAAAGSEDQVVLEVPGGVAVTKDPRVLFALFSPTKKGPSLRAFSADTLDEQLNEATVIMCDTGVYITSDSTVHISSLFKEFMKDFATSEENLLKWLSKCVTNTDKKIALYFAALDKSFLSYSFQDSSQEIKIASRSPEGKKVGVDFYISSLCPDTHDLFIQQVMPTFTDIKKIMNINIITFGKASVTPLRNGEEFKFECQNGPLECLGNKIMSCVVEYLPTDIQIPLLSCLMERPSITKALIECGRENDVPITAIKECYTTIEADRILYENGLKTLTLEPSLFFVPTVTVNKVYNDTTLHDSMRHFSSFICNSYLADFDDHEGISTPPGCKLKIDIFFESLNKDVHRFFIEQLMPTFQRVGESMNVQLIPYGKTTIAEKGPNGETDIKSRLKCPQGSLECHGNILMGCIAELLPIDAQIRAVSCIMKRKIAPIKGRECTSQEFNWDFIKECLEGPKGTEILLRNKQKTESLGPKLVSVPTVTVNKINNDTFTEWAQHDLTALVCDAFLMSSELQGRVTLPKGCPVRVEIYIEMLCPDTKRFFLKIFYPAWQKLRTLIDLHLIPFGKANVWKMESGQGYEFECQHGPLECQGNKIMSCIVEYLPVDLQVEVIACMMRARSPSHAGQKCAEKLLIAWKPLKDCYSSHEASNLLFQNGVRTMNLKPPFYFVPTISINRYYDSETLEKSLNNFEEQICQSYQDPFKKTSMVLTPKGCKVLIEVYFITFAEDSKRFLLHQLLPTWKKLSDVIHLKLIPIGRSPEFRSSKNEFSEGCTKDSACSADLLFSCVTQKFEIDKQMSFLECIIKSNSSMIASKKCAQNLLLSWDKISKCYQSPEGMKHLEANFYQTEKLRPTFHTVPTVLVNGFYDKETLRKSQENLLIMICSSFYDPDSPTVWQPHGCPVKVEVYMSSLSPETKRFFIHQLKPTWKDLSNILDLKFIPFGKASAKIVDSEEEDYEFECQHGPLECYGNRVMSCIVREYSVDNQVLMFSCMLEKEYPAVEGRECAERLRLEWNPVTRCADTDGAALLYQNGLQTQNLSPKILFIPTVTMNGFHSKSSRRKTIRNLAGVVCSKFLEKIEDVDLGEIPEGCRVKVQVFFHSLDHSMKTLFSQELEEFWRIYRRIAKLEFLPLKYSPKHEIHEDCYRENCFQSKVLGCLSQTENSDVQIEFIACLMLQDGGKEAVDRCSIETGVNKDELKACASSPKSLKILEDNQEHFLKLQRPSQQLPMILVGKTILLHESHLRKLTCVNYHGPTPQECLT